MMMNRSILALSAFAAARVAGVALIAPALRLKGLQLALLKRASALPLLEILRPWVTKDGSDIEDPVARAQAPLLPAFPTSGLR